MLFLNMTLLLYYALAACALVSSALGRVEGKMFNMYLSG